MWFDTRGYEFWALSTGSFAIFPTICSIAKFRVHGSTSLANPRGVKPVQSTERHCGWMYPKKNGNQTGGRLASQGRFYEQLFYPTCENCEVSRGQPVFVNGWCGVLLRKDFTIPAPLRRYKANETVLLSVSKSASPRWLKVDKRVRLSQLTWGNCTVNRVSGL